MIPNFRPGAGGLIDMSYMANVAPRDGSEISLLLAPTLLVAILDPQHAKFDARKLNWIGSMFPRTGAVWLWSKGPAHTLEEAKRVQTVLGSAGIGSETYQTPKLMNALLGTKFKIVTGYKSGAQINLAIERGEINGRQQNYLGWEAAGRHEWVVNKTVVPIIQTGPKEPALGDVPSFRDLVKPGEERDTVELHEIGGYIGLGVFAPPDVPKARADALRHAFAETMKAQRLLDDARKAKVVINPKTSGEIAGIIGRGYGYSEEVRNRLRAAFSTR